MPSTLNLPYPPFFINGYIKYQLTQFGIIGPSEKTPMLPVTPDDPFGLYQQLLTNSNIPNPMLIQYDRLIRFRPSPFYRRKREQIVYTFFCNSLDKQNMAMAMVTEALDRQDSTAQDINAWAASNTLFDDDGITPIPKNVYFHNFRVYQVDESRDLVELASVNMSTQRGKIIVEFDYHTIDPEGWPFT